MVMRVFLYGFVAIAGLLCRDGSGAEIFRCEDPGGGVVFQQTPCPEPEPEEPEPDEEKADEAPVTAYEAEPEPRAPAAPEVVAACKKQYRDAIDAIDAEMRAGFTPQQGEVFKQRLRLLTEKLRAC
jgi:hypothetical protein